MTLPNLDDGQLQYNDQPRIAWILVQDAVKLLSPHNPKLHDMGGIIQSILEYGLQELPKWDRTVNWIKAGNGRVEAIAQMELSKDKTGASQYKLPRGLALTKDGKWAMPLLIGVDAKNENQALRYLLDSNNLTMTGGDFGAFDLSKMWDEESYNQLLMRLAQDGEYTVSIPADTLVFLNSAGNSLVDYYKNRENEKNIDSVLGDILGLKVLLVIKSRRHEQEAVEAVKLLISEHPEWEMEIA